MATDRMHGMESHRRRPAALPSDRTPIDRTFYCHGFGSHFDPAKDKVAILASLAPVHGITVDYTRPRLQPGHLLALHRAARSHGRLVVDQPATEADQDRGACRPPCPRHHLPTGRGGRHRPDGVRHPCCHPPIESATAMRVTAILTQTERRRHDRSTRCAENAAAGPGRCGSAARSPASESLQYQ
jgi:hypothetical protein